MHRPMARRDHNADFFANAWTTLWFSLRLFSTSGERLDSESARAADRNERDNRNGRDNEECHA
ncbi:hypothetical protein J6500_20600 [Bradyrhizobium sp. WSM 1704]|uniref:hypothetical protein n=1 Tax=Bradyrhizobium semiaridum TaxID=2821404 RepID=UPI001CE39891|nr:hypothetical protein [Bradyrhizobium semiaridum]MCA6124273.1 hypothetical protein [Bradyrhizobium semiaridum]